MSDLALKLIAENKRTKATTLDLGRCGLTQLPDLSELHWLETLIASSDWQEFDQIKNRWVLFMSQNTRAKNQLLSPPSHPLPPRLKKVVFSGCEIRDGRFLEKLSHLTSLDLSYDQISDWRFLEKLTGLTSLYLRSNQISDGRFFWKNSQGSLRFTSVTIKSATGAFWKNSPISLRLTSVTI